MHKRRSYDAKHGNKSRIKTIRGGTRFGKLVLLRFVRKDVHRNTYWNCQCDCGNTKIISLCNLLSGNTRSCRRCNTAKDYTGSVFGRLVSTGRLGYLEDKTVALECECSCPEKTLRFFALYRLLDGQTKSCGCLRRELMTKKSGTDVRNMICRYKVSARGRKLQWELSNTDAARILMSPCRYSGTTPSRGIDRVDNTQGYFPWNCVPCCKVCNRAKLNMTLDDFNAWLDRMCTFRSPKCV